MTAICPSCNQNVTAPQAVIMKSPIQNIYSTQCIAWTCPHCSTILGMQMDPIEVTSKVAEVAGNKAVDFLIKKIQP